MTARKALNRIAKECREEVKAMRQFMASKPRRGVAEARGAIGTASEILATIRELRRKIKAQNQGRE